MNKFLSQIEKIAEMSDAARISRTGRTAAEKHIAARHGKHSPRRDFVGSVVNDVSSDVRTTTRGLIEGGALAAGAYKGTKALSKYVKRGGPSGVTSLSKFKVGKTIGKAAVPLGVAGYLAGAIHGTNGSLNNQAAELNNKYSNHEKKAALDQLMDHGVDFDTAVALIEKEAGMLGNAIGAVKSVFSTPQAKSVIGGMTNTVKGVGQSFVQDAKNAPGQMASMVRGKQTLVGSRFTTPMSQKVDRMQVAKDMIKNKALVTGAVGGVGAGALMASSPRKPTDAINDKRK